jgi:hypothetical protein
MPGFQIVWWILSAWLVITMLTGMVLGMLPATLLARYKMVIWRVETALWSVGLVLLIWFLGLGALVILI